MNGNDLVWASYLEQRNSARAFDEQRTSIANFIITIAGALIGFSATSGFAHASVVIYSFVALLGAYGAAVTWKLYETSSFCMERARRTLRLLSGPEVDSFQEITETTLAGQRKRFRVVARIHLYPFWIALHLLILLYALVAICVCIAHSRF
jgi:hypothetical protein